MYILTATYSAKRDREYKSNALCVVATAVAKTEHLQNVRHRSDAGRPLTLAAMRRTVELRHQLGNKPPQQTASPRETNK